MKNIVEICKEYGFEVAEDKQQDFLKAVAENYKTIAEHDKKIGKLEAERDAFKERAETAEETLKGFDGVDLQTIQNELANYKKRAEDAEKEYESKLYARDFEDALKAELEAYSFTSEAAKKSVVTDIKAADLKLKNGKILGLNDLIEQIKSTDASAFVDEKAEALETNRAKFTVATQAGKPETKGNDKKAEIMGIADREQRRAAILQNLNLFKKGE